MAKMTKELKECVEYAYNIIDREVEINFGNFGESSGGIREYCHAMDPKLLKKIVKENKKFIETVKIRFSYPRIYENDIKTLYNFLDYYCGDRYHENNQVGIHYKTDNKETKTKTKRNFVKNLFTY